jgi:DNA-binding transcriptional MerR regulator
MPDFFLAEHLAAKLGLLQKELSDFEARGVIRRVAKNGRTYYSSQDFYRLKGVLHFMRNKGLSVEAARGRVEAAARAVSATAQ